MLLLAPLILLAHQGIAVEPEKKPHLAGFSAPLNPLIYVGTYTDKTSKGIYAFQFDSETGSLTPVGEPTVTKSPSFLVIADHQRRLYAVNEATAEVSAFKIEAPGKLTLMNTQPSKGAAPCHLVVDHEMKHVLVANYMGGNLAVLPLAEDGSLKPASDVVKHEGTGPNKQRQEAPHAHSIGFVNGSNVVMSCDLGADKVFLYNFDPQAGKLAAFDPASFSIEAGSGPRHVVLDPRRDMLYVINELNSTISVVHGKPDKTFEVVQTISTVPDDFKKDNSTAEVMLGRAGKWLYASNRGHDSLAIYDIDAATGKLTLKRHQSTFGKSPRHFNIDPSGRWLLVANQDSDSIFVFVIDPETGDLKQVGGKTDVSMPVCIVFDAWKSSFAK